MISQACTFLLVLTRKLLDMFNLDLKDHIIIFKFICIRLRNLVELEDKVLLFVLVSSSQMFQ